MPDEILEEPPLPPLPPALEPAVPAAPRVTLMVFPGVRPVNQDTPLPPAPPPLPYAVGQQIVPTTPNGRVYSCIIAGTSGTVEPSFPQITYNVGQTWEDGEIGPNLNYPLTWEDAGFIQQEKYDVRAAAREGWMRKASIAANLANTNDGKMSIQLHIIQENCIQMASKYRSFGIL